MATTKIKYLKSLVTTIILGGSRLHSFNMILYVSYKNPGLTRLAVKQEKNFIIYPIKIVLFNQAPYCSVDSPLAKNIINTIIKFISSIRLRIGIGLLATRVISNYAARLFLTLEEFIIEWEVISLGSSTISLVIMLDFISLYFISLVRLVAGRVIVFSTSYISGE